MGNKIHKSKSNKAESNNIKHDHSSIDTDIFKDSEQIYDHSRINTDIFKNSEQICNGYDNCCYLTRIMEAFSYHNILSSKHPEIFVDFCDRYYTKQYLEDYIHFMCVHKDDLNNIKQLQSNNCSKVNGCFLTQRHFRDRMRNNEEKHDDEAENVLIDIFDNMHFYMYHMEECGLRIKINMDDIENAYENQNVSVYADEIIATIENEIQKTKKKCGLFKRLDSAKNSKFNIVQSNCYKKVKVIYDSEENDEKQDAKSNKSSNTKDKKSVFKKIQNAMRKINIRKEKREETFTDDLLHHIGSVGVEKSIIRNLTKYLLSQEYDTDCIENDIDIYDDIAYCNILNASNVKCIKKI
eukprot:389635_1